MRLTLRTLLAYLDDILEPSQAKEIGAKIAQSDFAATLTSRIRDVMRRRRLTAPDVEGTGGVDPNTVAEYLDNTLPPNAVAEVERIFLESDVHLAEVAASHQILTLVLGEPVEIVPESRERMYALGPEPRHDAELAAAMDGAASAGNGTAAASVVPATIAAKTVPVKSFSESLPPQLRRKPLWKRAFPYVAVLGLAAAFVGLVLTDPSLFPGLGLGELSEDNEPGGTKIAGIDNVKSGPIVQNTDRRPPPVGKTESPVLAARSPDGKLLPLPPVPDGVNRKPPPDVPEVGIGGKTPAIKQPTIVGQNPPVPIASLPGGKLPATIGKIPVPPGKSVPQPASAGQTPKITYQALAGKGLFLLKNPKGRDWQVIPALKEIAPGSRVATAAPFHSLLEIGGKDCRALLASGTSVEILPRTTTALFGFDVLHGRVVLSGPTALAKNQPKGLPKNIVVALQIRGERFRLELLSPETVCGIEVTRTQPYGYEKPPGKDHYSGALYVSAGSVRFSDAKGNIAVVAAAENTTGRMPLTRSLREAGAAAGKLTETVQPVEAPLWLRPTGEPLSKATLGYAEMYLKEFEVDMGNLAEQGQISVLDNAMAIIQDRRAMVSQYAAELLATTESYPELVKALDVAPHEESRNAAIEGLRSWLLTDPANGRVLKAELGKIFSGGNTDALYRLLWGFNEQDARDETTSQLLVSWLGHGHIAVRELAFLHVHRLTGRRYEYRANLRAGQLSLAYNQWRQHVNRHRALLPPKPEKKD